MFFKHNIAKIKRFHSPVVFSKASGYRVPTTSMRWQAASMACNSIAVSSMPAAALFSLRRCSLVVPGNNAQWFLNFKGLVPVCFLKKLLKWVVSENPRA